MAISKTPLHIICGMCGSNEMLRFTINPVGDCNNDGDEIPAVFVTCSNCSTLTNLSQSIPESEADDE